MEASEISDVVVQLKATEQE